MNECLIGEFERYPMIPQRIWSEMELMPQTNMVVETVCGGNC